VVTQGFCVDIIHNSVLVNPNNSSPSSEVIGLTALSFSNFGSDSYGQVRLLNNTFVNKSGGKVINIPESPSRTRYVTELDYNNYYTTGDVFGEFEGDGISDLLQWQQ